MQDRDGSIIAPSAADRLIAAHDGDVALLYIYITRTGCTDMERAAGDLCRTMQEISSAEEKLRRMGLLGAAGAKRPAPAEGLPQYTAADLTRRSQEDPGFSIILAEARNVMGRTLSSNDMRILFGIYDYLALPTDVILTLLHYCGECCTRLYGGRRTPTIKGIEQEAYRWANREILTLDLAEEYIRREKEKAERASQLKTLLGIRRDLSPTERKYISAWAEMGFDDEVIALALDRTLTQTGSLRWAYMNKILQSWQEKQLFTVEDIESGDSRGGRRGAAKPGGDEHIDISRLDDIISKI